MKYLELLKKAKKERKPIFQFNFSDLCQLKGIIEGILPFKKPFILGTSEGESNFLGINLAVALKREIEKSLKIPIILNLDHGKSYQILKKAIDSGYDMVHFDGSFLPLNENIKLTKKVVKLAHKKGILVEGEVGMIKSSSQFHKKIARIKKEELTDPDEAKDFVRKTKVDLLAVSIGNIHGIYLKMPKLDLKRLSMIKKKIEKIKSDIFLVLHGGSGIKNKNLKNLAERGIVKININTEIRLAWKKGIEKDLLKNPDEIAPYKLFKKGIENVKKVVFEKMKIFK